MNSTICKIYATRPDMCKVYPTHESEISEFDKCTYKFVNGVRKGQCCACGQCCTGMSWPTAPDDARVSKVSDCVVPGVETKQFYHDEICRYLING